LKTPALVGLTVAEYAARRGITPRALRIGVKKGWTVHYADGSIDPGRSDARWLERADPVKGGPRKGSGPKPKPAPTPDPTIPTIPKLADVIASLPEDLKALPHNEIRRLLDAANVQIARIKAEIVGLQLAQAKGEVVPVADVAPVWFRIGRGVRDRVLAVPVRVAPESVALVLSHAGDAGAAAVALSGLLDRELRAALIDLDKAPSTGGQP
jgi:hypothetical protein